MSISKDDVSHQKVEQKINELKTRYPIATAILERIPSMDLKEVVSVILLADGVRWLLKVRAMRLVSMEDKDVDEQKVQQKINDLRTNYPLAAAILERVHNMDLKETTTAMFIVDGLDLLLRIRAMLILQS
jgi:glucose/arabinose dehydrogenase